MSNGINLLLYNLSTYQWKMWKIYVYKYNNDILCKEYNV